MNARPNIVLVHGAWADGSSWSGVIEPLQEAGYHVTAPQFPMTSLAADVARLRQVLDFQNGPVIVAGHSYGGQIMTALGPDVPNAAGLACIALSASIRGNRSAPCWPRDRRLSVFRTNRGAGLDHHVDRAILAESRRHPASSMRRLAIEATHPL